VLIPLDAIDYGFLPNNMEMVELADLDRRITAEESDNFAGKSALFLWFFDAIAENR